MTGRRGFFVAVLFAMASLQVNAAEQHAVQGILLKVDQTKRSIVVSCDAIPGYMEAMVMPFEVREASVLKTLAIGTTVRFDMVEQGREDYAEHLQAIKVTNYEAEPTEAARLTFLHRALNPAAAAKIVPVGQVVPDFALVDQTQRPTHFAQFRGKVVALTFAYSRCPNPN